MVKLFKDVVKYKYTKHIWKGSKKAKVLQGNGCHSSNYRICNNRDLLLRKY